MPNFKIEDLWAKTQRRNDYLYHPVLHHMIDAGNVARVLLDPENHTYHASALSRVLFGAPDRDLRFLVWLVATHDIGKISAPFQVENETQRRRLAHLGYPVNGTIPSIHHAPIGQQVAKRGWGSWKTGSKWERVWGYVLGSHHREPAKPDQVENAWKYLKIEDPCWAELRNAALNRLGQLFGVSPDNLPEERPGHQTMAILHLTGFTVFCDWIASNEKFFPFSSLSTDEYAQVSYQRAREALSAAGYLSPDSSAAPTQFAALFPHIKTPFPVQKAVDRIPDSVLEKPFLAILEAPMGEGKTETAWAIAHRRAKHSGTDAFYFALPTMATSTQMYHRSKKYLEQFLHLGSLARLLHGQSERVPEYVEGVAEDIRPYLTNRRLAILAQFGIGTIDQIELAAMNAQHFALRLFGLMGKTVILDEVHAYDQYMVSIIERLLMLLKDSDTSVIIQSATLPSTIRTSLVEAYGISKEKMNAALEQAAARRGQKKWNTRSLPYPLLVVANQDEAYVDTPKARNPNRRVYVEFINYTHNDPRAKARFLLGKVKNGGTIVWFCNTVDRAQELYRAVKDEMAEQGRAAPEIDLTGENRGAETSLTLFHARFPLADRLQIERDLIKRYGPGERDSNGKLQANPHRPKRGIVIATQVLEQSLDLDFDVAITDFAPVDLLLQRVGREHRHSIHKRKHSHRKVKFYINLPLGGDDGQGQPDFGVDSCIYDEYILRNTQIFFEKLRMRVVTTRDFRTLIEAVYNSDPPRPEYGRIFKAWQEYVSKRDLMRSVAALRLLQPPDPDTYNPAYLKAGHDEQNSEEWITADTRFAEENAEAVILERDAAGNSARLPDGTPVDLNRVSDPELTNRILMYTVRLARKLAVEVLKAEREKAPPLFTHTRSRLKYHYPLFLENGTATLTGADGKKIRFTLDKELGLVMENLKKGQ